MQGRRFAHSVHPHRLIEIPHQVRRRTRATARPSQRRCRSTARWCQNRQSRPCPHRARFGRRTAWANRPLETAGRGWRESWTAPSGCGRQNQHPARFDRPKPPRRQRSSPVRQPPSAAPQSRMRLRDAKARRGIRHAVCPIELGGSGPCSSAASLSWALGGRLATASNASNTIRAGTVFWIATCSRRASPGRVRNRCVALSTAASCSMAVG